MTEAIVWIGALSLCAIFFMFGRLWQRDVDKQAEQRRRYD